jgi:hypothetical protein
MVSIPQNPRFVKWIEGKTAAARRGTPIPFLIIEIKEETVEGEDGEEIQMIAITQGDANNTPDDPIQLSQIKGTVVMSIPLVGYLVNMIKTPLGTILILAAAVFLLERSFHKEKEKDLDKLEEIRREIEKLKEQSNKQEPKA